MIKDREQDTLAPAIVTGHEDKFHYEIADTCVNKCVAPVLQAALSRRLNREIIKIYNANQGLNRG